MLYFDNAATTLQKPPCVAQAVLEALSSFGNVGRGAHSAAMDAGRCVFAARQTAARLFHAPRADHVVFTSGATEALNLAIGGLFAPGDHVISTDLEHNSVLRPLYRFAAQGGQVSFLPADGQGRLRTEKLEGLLQTNTRALLCTHASNLTGDMPPIPLLREFCRRNGLLLLLDCSQTAGTMPVDMEALGADVICFTGHKGLMGPQGTGGLCIRPGVEIRPWKVGGTGVQTFSEVQPEQYPVRLEAGTANSHGIAGLLAAMEYLEKTDPAVIHDHCLRLARSLREGFSRINGVTVYGNWEADHAAIVSMNFSNLSDREAADLLSERYGIAVRAGAHCAPRLHRALGTENRGAVRFSPGWFTPEEQVEQVLEAAKELSRL